MRGAVYASTFIQLPGRHKTMNNPISSAEISASKIQSDMLNARNKPWAEYIPTMRRILEKIKISAKMSIKSTPRRW
jgi:hypothetical protein